jgi:hypothetical protein
MCRPKGLCIGASESSRLNDPLDECPFHVVVVTIDGSLLKSIVSGSREVFFRARGLGRSGVFGRITLRNGTVALH